MKRKRIGIFSDLHCGHQVGLTPPDWQYRHLTNNAAKHNKFAEVQRQCWAFFSKRVKQAGPFDVAIINADCIDGRGEKSGGTELIEIDRQKQCEMAIECIEHIKAKKIVMTYGTPYHVGQVEDWENSIAKALNAESIGAHEWVGINGKIIDIKHKLGSSGVPHGRGTALFKEWLWNSLWSEAGEQPKADIFVRSHVHYFTKVEGADWEALSTPALQAMGSKFGARQCSGIVHFGFLVLDIDSDGRTTWQKHIAKIQAQQAHVLKL